MAAQVTIATGSYDRKICFWEAGTGKCLKQLTFPDSQINCLSLSTDKQRIAVGGFASIRVFDLAPHASAAPSSSMASEKDKHHTTNVTALIHLIPSAAGGTSLLLSAGEDGYIRLWDPRSATMRLRRELNAQSPVNAICVSRDQKYLFVGTEIGIVTAWDLESFAGGSGGGVICIDKPVQEIALSSDDSPVRSLSISPQGTLVVAATNAGTLHCLADTAALRRNSTTSAAGAAQPGIPLVASAEDASGRESSEGSPLASPPEAAAENYSTGDAGIATRSTPVHGGSGDGFDARAGGKKGGLLTPLAAVPAHSKYILKVTISPDGTLVAAAAADYTVSLWRVPKQLWGAVERSAIGDSGTAAPSSASPSKQPSFHVTVSAASDSPQPTTMSPTGMRSQSGFPGIPEVTEGSAAIAASPAAGSAADSPAAPTLTHLRTLIGHQRWVWDAAFSSCSRYLVTVSSDHTGRLWDLRSGSLVVAYSGHSKPVSCVVLDDKPAQ